MDTVLTLLAVLGGLTAAWHLVRAALRFLGRAAEGIWADEMAQTQARRGDVTAFEESRRERMEARRSGLRSGAAALFWAALLTAPAFAPEPRPVFAAYSLLLLLPLVRRVRP